MTPKNKVISLAVLSAALALTAAAVLVIFIGSGTQSGRARLDGDIMAVAALMPGQVELVALPGQEVRAGDTLLQINAEEFAREAMEMKQRIQELAASVPESYSRVLADYLAIPQSEEELLDMVEKAAVIEKETDADLQELVGRQAAFSLGLRGLELKSDKNAEEKKRLAELLLEEEVMRSAVQNIYRLHENASLDRAGLAKLLERKRGHARLLNSAPAQAQAQLAKMREIFQRMYALEERISNSVITAPVDGLVSFVKFNAGDTVGAGDVALYFIPKNSPGIWVSAWFRRDLAENMQTGEKCAVRISQGARTLELEGRVGERQTYADVEPSGEAPVKVLLPSLRVEELTGLNPEEGITVSFE